MKEFSAAVMSRRAVHLYHFGSFHLDAAERVLYHGSEPVPLTPKAFETLLLLVGKPGHVVEKDELMKAVWPDTFVEEANLGQQVFQLRKALGEGVDGTVFIETVPRRGYRFVAEVKETWDDGRPPRKKLWVLLAASMLLVLAGLAYWRAARGTGLQIRSIAVLPLDDLSGPAAPDYFADGMTEALIIDLSKIGALRVISRPAVMRYKGTRKPPAEVARDLKVDALVVGSVLRSAQRVRITAQLVYPAKDRQLWAESYERELRDILTLQHELAQAIAAEIRVSLTPREGSLLAKTRVVNPEAYDLYLRGRYLISRANDADNWAAIEALERTVALDPLFASGYAALGTALSTQSYLYAAGTHERWHQKASAAVEKALALDPDSPEAHLARAELLWAKRSSWPDTLGEYHRAVALNPNFAEARERLGRLYGHIGLLEEALRETQLAAALSPGTPGVLYAMGQTLLWQGKYDKALPVWLSVSREYLPSLTGGHTAWALLQLGRKDEAAAKIREFSALDPEDTGGVLASVEAVLLATDGRVREAEQKINHAAGKKVFFGHFHHSAYFVACAYARMNKPKETVRWLEDAVESGFSCYPLFEKDASLEPVRSDPRFRAFIDRMRREFEERTRSLDQAGLR